MLKSSHVAHRRGADSIRGQGLVKAAPTVWQARLVDLPQPDPDTPHLADVAPSVLSAMGVAGFMARIPLPDDVAGACVLLIDGLGAELLDDMPRRLSSPVCAADVAGRLPFDDGRRARRAGHRVPVGRARHGRYVVSAAGRRCRELVAVASAPLGRRRAGTARRPRRCSRYRRYSNGPLRRGRRSASCPARSSAGPG